MNWFYLASPSTFFRFAGRLANIPKLGKPLAEVASGKMAAPFNALSGVVLSHASEEGAVAEDKGLAGAKSLLDNLKAKLATKPKDKAA